MRATTAADRRDYCEDHMALLAAFSHRDGEDAETQARRHVRRVAEAALRR